MDLPALAVAAGLAGWTPSPVAAPKAVAARAPLIPAEPVVVASPSGDVIKWDAMIDGLQTARVIAIGERHDQGPHHEVQAKILEELARRDPFLVVGLEMVSQDQQPILDRFQSGMMSEPEFANWWRENWRFDYFLYKPIFDAARFHHLKLYALNAPIAIVNKVGLTGLISLTPAERAQLPPVIRESDDVRYRDFVRESASHHGKPDRIPQMIEAQSVWNETMGAKVADLSFQSRVVVIAGEGHMLWRAGIPESAIRRGSGPATVVLPFPLDGEPKTAPELLKLLRDPETGAMALADDFVLLPL